MTALDDFFADSLRREVWLAELYPYDPNTGTTTTLYYSTEEWATLPTESPASQGYRAQLVTPWNVSLDAIAPGTVAILPDVRGGEIRLGSRFGDLDSLANYLWDGRRVVIKLAGFYGDGRRLGYADALTVFDGEVDQALVALDEVQLRLRDPETAWEDPVESVRYSGGTWMLDFGAGDVVTLGVPAKCNLIGDLTIAARVRFSSFAANNYIVSWKNSETVYPFLFRTTTSGGLFYNNSSITGATASTGVVPANTWSLIALTVTGTTLKLYAWDEVTGALLFAETKTLSSGSRSSGDGNLRVGEQGGASSSGWQLDWLLVDDRVFTQAELEALRYHQPTVAELATYALYLGCEDGSGTTAADTSPSPANGTISGCDWRPSLEGGADLAGKPKPNVFGWINGLTPTLVYGPTQIYQVHRAAVGAHTAVREGGNAITAGTAYTNLLTFLAATTTAGRYDTLTLAGGSFFRLGTNPTKPITWDGSGDASGSGYVSSAGDVWRRIVTTRGSSPLVDPTDLDTASFTALNTANSSAIGLALSTDDEMTIAAAAELLLGSVGAVTWFSRATRKLKVLRLEAVSGTPAGAVDENDIAKLDPSPVELPVWSVTVKYWRNWTPLSVEQLAGALVGTDYQPFYTEEWRSVTLTDPAVKAKHPRARELTIETGFSSLAVAEIEAARLLALYGAEHRAWKATVKTQAYRLDRWDVLTLSYSDLTSAGAAQQRFGLGAGTDYFVLGLTGDRGAGLETLTLWR